MVFEEIPVDIRYIFGISSIFFEPFNEWNTEEIQNTRHNCIIR